MQLVPYILRLTGLSYQQACVGTNAPLRVVSNEDGHISIAHWDEVRLGKPMMTPQEVAVVLDSAEYVDLTAYAANKRWLKETGGIVVGGVLVSTDDRSKQMIIGARLAAQADDDFTTSWVGSDGNVTPLNAAQIIGISDAVATHVAACFETFATVRSSIIAGTITTSAQIDQAFAA